ncbi:MAG: TadE/TadG family type IV pilus assembly protein [Gaiellales bacterium]
MIRNIMHDERGQAVTEFAVILPVLLLVLFAIFQFGVIFNNYIQVAAAAREGARKGAVSRTAGSCSVVQGMVVSSAQNAAPGLSTSTMGVTVNDTCTNNAVAAGTDMKVTVTYPWSVSLLGQVVASGTLSSATTMRVE